MDEAEVPEEEQARILAELGKKEAEFMRVQRRKTTVDDFELLTIIGRGAFGEVRGEKWEKGRRNMSSAPLTETQTNMP